MDSIGGILQYSGVSLLIVFIALFVIVLCIFLLLRIDGWLEKRERARPAQIKEQTVDDLTLVLITASVAALIRQRVQIKRVRRISSSLNRRSSWSSMGRVMLLGSHDTSKNK